MKSRDEINCESTFSADWLHWERSFFSGETSRHLELIGTEHSVWLRPGEKMLTLGRSPTTSLAVQAPEVSRVHAVVKWRRGRFVVRDVSSFGTWVYYSGKSQPVVLHGTECALEGWGRIGLGGPVDTADSPSVAFGVRGG